MMKVQPLCIPSLITNPVRLRILSVDIWKDDSEQFLLPGIS